MTASEPSEVNDLEDDAEDELNPSRDQSEALDLTVEDRRLVTQPYDLGVRSISDDIDEHRILLSIEYQRKYVWDDAKASRLIESLLLNVPIPVCYFAEDEEGAYEVIDGLQRLTTIKRFLDGEFALTGISVLTELDGKRYNDLAPRDQRRLESRTIRCIVITDDSHPDIKFDVFERLNTGAASLTAQELRNSIYRGALNDALKFLADEDYFTDLLGGSSNKRMEYEELVLRFFALTEGVLEYRPPLRQFLNEYMRRNRELVPSLELVSRFEDSCRTALEVFGEVPFRLPGSRNLNKALFDAIMIPIAYADREALLDKASDVRAVLKILLESDEFKTAIGRATADRFRMLYRIGAVAEGFKALDVDVAMPDRLGLGN